MKKIILIITVFFALFFDLSAEHSLNANLEIFSRHIWRGSTVGSSPAFEPMITYKNEGFQSQFWGCFTSNNDYNEYDVLLSYKTGGFQFGAYDYYVVNMDKPELDDWLNWDNKSTRHTIDLLAEYNHNDFPFRFYASCLVYGDDKNKKFENVYSVYLETAFKFSFENANAELILGITPADGLYAKEFHAVNAAFKVSQNLIISDKYSMPISAVFGVNPAARKVFMNAGIKI